MSSASRDYVAPSTGLLSLHGHSPWHLIVALMHLAAHSLPAVAPLSMHTGAYMRGQATGHTVGWKVVDNAVVENALSSMVHSGNT